jgi:hypothetical protein
MPLRTKKKFFMFLNSLYACFVIAVLVRQTSWVGGVVSPDATIEEKLEDQRKTFRDFYNMKIAIPHPHTKANDNSLYQHILKESFTNGASSLPTAFYRNITNICS